MIGIICTCRVLIVTIKYQISKIPKSDVLDPFIDTDDEIKMNLTFEDEIITAYNGSIKGLNTIKKFRLDTELLDYLRMKQIKKFYSVILNIKDKMIHEKRDQYTQEEENDIRSFCLVDHQYSLMFEKLIKKHNLL